MQQHRRSPTSSNFLHYPKRQLKLPITFLRFNPALRGRAKSSLHFARDHIDCSPYCAGPLHPIPSRQISINAYVAIMTEHNISRAHKFTQFHCCTTLLSPCCLHFHHTLHIPTTFPTTSTHVHTNVDTKRLHYTLQQCTCVLTYTLSHLYTRAHTCTRIPIRVHLVHLVHYCSTMLLPHQNAYFTILQIARPHLWLFYWTYAN